jgi:hypothetical protein
LLVVSKVTEAAGGVVEASMVTGNDAVFEAGTPHYLASDWILHEDPQQLKAGYKMTLYFVVVETGRGCLPVQAYFIMFVSAHELMEIEPIILLGLFGSP